MTNILHFTGFIKGVTYKTYLHKHLEEILLDKFDANQGNCYGLITNYKPHQLSINCGVEMETLSNQ